MASCSMAGGISTEMQCCLFLAATIVVVAFAILALPRLALGRRRGEEQDDHASHLGWRIGARRGQDAELRHCEEEQGGYRTPERGEGPCAVGGLCEEEGDADIQSFRQKFPEYDEMNVLLMALSSMTDKQLEARASRKCLEGVRDKADRIAAVLKTGVSRASKWQKNGRDPWLVSTFCDDGMTDTAANFALGMHPGAAQIEWSAVLSQGGVSPPGVVSPKDLFGGEERGESSSSSCSSSPEEAEANNRQRHLGQECFAQGAEEKPGRGHRQRRRVRLALDFDEGSQALCPSLHKLMDGTSDAEIWEALGEVEANRCRRREDAISSLLRLARTRARLGKDLGAIKLSGTSSVRDALDLGGEDAAREWRELCRH